MITPALPSNEKHRLNALLNANILDTLPEKDFDDLTLIASTICQTPISLITLVDSDRQWFKSKVGLEAQQTERRYAFCAHAILNPSQTLVVNDSREDERFKENPLVLNEPYVIFYAGVPLVDKYGYPYGTICVIDQQPRELSEQQIKALKTLASLVMNQIELRNSRKNLEIINQQLEAYNYRIAHDLKSPLSGMIALLDLINIDKRIDEFPEIKEYLNLLNHASQHLSGMIGAMLDAARKNVKDSHPELVKVHELVQNTIELLFPPSHIEVHFANHLPEIKTVKIKLLQVFQNLLSNAIKFSDKDKGYIEIGCKENEDYYLFYVKDNGPGISREDRERIFELFETADHTSLSENSSGIGLNTIKQIVKEMGGTIWLDSEPEVGTCFYFTWKKQ